MFNSPATAPFLMRLPPEGNPNRLCREQGRSSSKDELSQELATSSKIPSMGLGSFSQRVNPRVDFGYEKFKGCNCVELGLSNGWAKAQKSEIPKIAFILVSSAAAAQARHLHRAGARCPCLGGYETGWRGRTIWVMQARHQRKLPH
ncbi:hypothetical protein PIB30_083577 [Stylosanthes scabra]|uniref:Uncharacterized protein n=1 Tax=Stylosanthes scabra TaxID=79078 RepID=A0ABU6URQ1_9FABA|nr:hypothetical protein [Stylosanthes scabra]